MNAQSPWPEAPKDYAERVRYIRPELLHRQVRESDLALRQLRFAAQQHRQHMRDLIAIGLGAVAGLVFVAVVWWLS